jgi:hypothetical protein
MAQCIIQMQDALSGGCAGPKRGGGRGRGGGLELASLISWWQLEAQAWSLGGAAAGIIESLGGEAPK